MTLWLSKLTPSWVLVKGLNLSYHTKEIILFSIDPYYGNGFKLSYHNKETILFSIHPYYGSLNYHHRDP